MKVLCWKCNKEEIDNMTAWFVSYKGIEHVPVCDACHDEIIAESNRRGG